MLNILVKAQILLFLSYDKNETCTPHGKKKPLIQRDLHKKYKYSSKIKMERSKTLG